MKIVLQDKTTRLFFKGAGEWVKDDRDATVFPHSSAALEFCMKNKLANLHILLKFGDNQYDVRLLVGEESSIQSKGRPNGGDSPSRS